MEFGAKDDQAYVTQKKIEVRPDSQFLNVIYLEVWF